ncbi:MAG TPA: hypothetical protein VFV86_09540 [Nitrososphaeraceae archaeon]|nr:hypothetical protein [Nitrososphaeraceae archaeon]
MDSEEEINQLREKIQNTINEGGGISNLLTNLANQANYNLELNESPVTLNSLDNAILKLMMIDFLKKNNFN